ncbi:MAG: respiratory nitrate reductase subunit gamma, partial [Bacteroidales bacterium]
MTNFWDNTLFNYLPHVVIALLIFGIATRFVKASKTIQATSVQLLSKNKLYDMALLLFHYGIVFVLLGHIFGLFTPRWLYELVMTPATKRILAITMGSFFGVCAFIGIVILSYRRLMNERVHDNSSIHDIFISLLVSVQIFLGVWSTAITAVSPPEQYFLLDTWAKGVVSLSPNAASVMSQMSLIHKLHILTGLFIFVLFPYSKLMHFLVAPVQYLWRRA